VLLLSVVLSKAGVAKGRSAPRPSDPAEYATKKGGAGVR